MGDPSQWERHQQERERTSFFPDDDGDDYGDGDGDGDGYLTAMVFIDPVTTISTEMKILKGLIVWPHLWMDLIFFFIFHLFDVLLLTYCETVREASKTNFW